MKSFIRAATVLLAAAGVAAAIRPSETAGLDAAARTHSARFATRSPQDFWTRARCVAVIPELKKAAFIVGGEYGKGVMSCRAGDQWSAPVFMQLAKGSWGFQAGAEQADVVLLVMNEAGRPEAAAEQGEPRRRRVGRGRAGGTARQRRRPTRPSPRRSSRTRDRAGSLPASTSPAACCGRTRTSTSTSTAPARAPRTILGEPRAVGAAGSDAVPARR